MRSSGAIAGTSYPIDTAALARKLGFSRVVSNSIDASSDRDFVAAFLFAVSLAMVHVSRIAEDLIIFTGEEHGFFELSDATATGSSMMPQKKNPDALELARGKSGRAIGRLAGWLVTMKGLPSGYNKDLQEDKEAVFEAEHTLAISLTAAIAVISRLTLNAEKASRAASGLLLATDVADYLAIRGMPFRQAHEIVGAMVRRLVAEGRDFSSLTLKEWKEASDFFGDDAPQAATPLESVHAKRTPQSTNPDAVQSALKDLKDWLNPKPR
jgi:argininosuccinate lyase